METVRVKFQTDGGPYCEHHSLRSVAGPTAQVEAAE